MIQLENIEKEYEGNGISTKALNGISLKIEDGELVSIIGPSGSGKTTLLNIIGCMDNVTAGRYFCGDTEVSALKNSKVEKFRKNNISFVFQQFALLNDYTVYENVELPLRVKNISRKELNKEGKTVIVVTHDLNIAGQTERTIQIKDGKIVGGEI